MKWESQNLSNQMEDLMGVKSQLPSLLVDGERSTQVVSNYTHCGTPQSRRWGPQVDGSSLDKSRAESRQLRQVSRARRLEMVMAHGTEATET